MRACFYENTTEIIRVHLREQVRGGGLTGLADVHHGPGPLRVAFVPIACLWIVGRFDPFRRWRQRLIGLESAGGGHGPRGGCAANGPLMGAEHPRGAHRPARPGSAQLWRKGA